MNITENWFYKTSDLEETTTIWDGLVVFLFDDGNVLKNITVWENTRLEYFSFFSEDSIFQKHILLSGKNSYCKVHSLIYSVGNTLDCKITWEVAADESKIDMRVISFAGKDGNVKIDGILQVNQWTKKVWGTLNEENIFLWDSGRISGFPTLLVATNDVQASHSCKMEKISDEKLFYLRSRWVSKEQSLSMMIEAKVVHLFQCLSMIDKEFYDELVERVLEKIE
jgi:Fe-S cluster assembly scaffold protein SufB